MNIDDVSYRDEGAVILLKRSKTDQRGEGRLVGIPYGKNPDTCPVAALKRWLQVSGITEGAIFRGLDRQIILYLRGYPEDLLETLSKEPRKLPDLTQSNTVATACEVDTVLKQRGPALRKTSS